MAMEQLTVPSDPHKLWKFFIDACSIADIPPPEALYGMLTACVAICKAPPDGVPAKTLAEWMTVTKLVWEGFNVYEVPDGPTN